MSQTDLVVVSFTFEMCGSPVMYQHDIGQAIGECFLNGFISIVNYGLKY